MSRSAVASGGTGRAAVESDAVRSTTAPARQVLERAAALTVGLAVVAVMFADLARVSVIPARAPDGPSFPAPED